jgi:hypothetical protein
MELPQPGELHKVQVSTNFISSTHEYMDTVENKYGQCLKYADQYADDGEISSSHTENFPHDNRTRFESSTLRS